MDASTRNVIIVTVGIALILGGLLFFNNKEEAPLTLDEMHAQNYAGEETEKNIIYNGFSFVLVQDPRSTVEFWYTQYVKEGQTFDVPFHYNPRQVEDIPITKARTNNATLNKTYLTLDPINGTRPNLGQSFYEISEKLVKIFGVTPEAACTKNETAACEIRPIINCENNKEDLVIYFKESVTPSVEIVENCILIKGNEESYLKQADMLIFRLMGII